MNRIKPEPRWSGPPLAWQIAGLLLLCLVVAQAVTLLLTLLLPPAPAPQYGLEDIAALLSSPQAATHRDGQLRVSLQPATPAPTGPGWLTSERSRRDLAMLLGVVESDVRLFFYTPLPFAGVTAGPQAHAEPPPPRIHPAQLPPSPMPERAGLMPVNFMRVQGPARGGAPGGGPAGGYANPAGGAVSPAPRSSPRPNGSTADARAPAAEGRGTTVPDAGVREGARSDTAPAYVTTWTGLPPAAPVAPAGHMANDASETALPASPAALAAPPPPAPPSAEPPALDSAVSAPSALLPRPALPVEAAPAASPAAPPAAPAEPVAAESTEAPAEVPQGRGLFGLAPAPFVQGDFLAALRQPDGRWAVVQPAPEPFPNAWQRRVALWFGLSALIVMPLGWRLSQRIVRPIGDFARVAERRGIDPTGEVLTLRGPAEIGRAAQAFNRMQARLKSFVENRTAMVSAISHDLRTPLTRLRFRIEDVPSEVGDGMLADVQEMEEMIRDVLAFMRDASEPGRRETLDLASIVEDVVEEAQFIGQPVMLDALRPARVHVDPIGIRRVLDNLISNAVKYGQRAHVRLSLDGAEAVVSVFDNGPGLSHDEIERVFQPFYRTAQARASGRQGSGLGLAICRTIARSHGGDVRLINLREGLSAQLRLPLALTPPPMAARDSLPPSATAGAPPLLTPHTA